MGIKKAFGIVGLLFLGSYIANSQTITEQVEADSTEKKAYEMVPDDPWIARMDSLLTAPYFGQFQLETDTNKLNVHAYSSDSIPKFSPEVYAERLAILDANSPFDLVYNDQVAGFIRLYAERRRTLTGKMMGLSTTYFPMFEEELDKRDLPLEIKYLAMVESALNPTARSRAGATGLWQFMYHTGKIYGLKIDSYVDERRDPVRSTEAACAYLKYLHGLFDDWNLALAAYNCGEGRVMRAIRRSGGKRNYWDLYPYLPRETRGYVPAFIALNYVTNYATEHNIYPQQPQITYFEHDTIHVKEQLALSSLAEILKMDQKQLEYLNPVYRQKVVPKSKEGRIVNLPNKQVALFELNRDSIYALNDRAPEKAVVVENQRQTHVVRRGEYLGLIANRYRVSVSDIRQWNGMRSSRINPGQRLIIYSNPGAVASVPKKEIKTEVQGNLEYYRIQKGDTLWDIAKAKGISLDELKRLNKNLNSRNLKPGSQIVVGTSG